MRNYRGVLIGLCFIQSLLITFSAFGQEANYAVSVDSVRLVTQDMPAAERLDYLAKLARKQSISPDYRQYIRLYEAEARRQHNDIQWIKSQLLLAGSFYPEDPDSIWVIKQRVEPIAEKSGEYDDYLELFGMYNYSTIWSGRQNGVEESVREYRNLAVKIGNVNAMELADQNMAYFYFLNNMLVEGEKLYLEALKSKEERNAPLAGQVGILVQLVNNLTKEEKRKKYLEQAVELIDRYKKGDEKDANSDRLMVVHEYSVHWSFASLLLEEGKSAEAYEHMQAMEELIREYNMKEDRVVALQQIYFEYYCSLKNWDKALEVLTELEEVMQLRNISANIKFYRSRRADIYAEQGRLREAIALQKEVIQLQDSIGQASLQEKMADMRTKYEVENLKLEKQQIEIDSLKTRNRVTLLTVGCIFLLLAIVGLVYLVRITQRSKRSFKRAKEKAEEADQMKTAFLANMNHEIRTPLNAIVGFSQVLIEEEEPENRREFADIIESNNELLQRLIADVLDISKIESNTMSLIYKEYDIEAMMKEIYSVISLRVPDTIRLILEPLEPITLETDRNRLMQVLTNLLTNAIKHTPTGYIRYGYTLSDTEIHFFVEDTGEGIPEESCESIFDRFTQLENGKKGVGLGLAICKGLITKMGGKIWVTSTVNVGSVFHVTLSLEKPADIN